MINDSFYELYSWARAHLNRPVLLGYLLHKVNGQIPNSLFILLRQPTSLRASAELEIGYYPDRDLPYLVSFSSLPLQLDNPRPDQVRLSFQSQQAVMRWIKTGQYRELLYSF